MIISRGAAKFEFIIRFYEFRNPLGLQCDKCESGGLPACCDDVQRNETCINMEPYSCDTGFNFLLRPYGASVGTVPNVGFTFTLRNIDNSGTFTEGPHGLLGYPNPFTYTSSMPWPVSVTTCLLFILTCFQR